MKILVDSRVGSIELLPLFPHNIAESAVLPFGDFAHDGCGPNGKLLRIGYERKVIPDLIQSFLSGRLAGNQLYGMIDTYDVPWLIVEGEYRNDENGILQVRDHGRWTSHSMAVNSERLWSFLLTITYRVGLRLWCSPNREQTVNWIVQQYKWWNVKEYSAHRSVFVPYIPLDDEFAKTQRHHVPFVRRMAYQYQGIGAEKARALAKTAGTAARLVTMTTDELMEIEGIGKVLAQRIVEQNNELEIC